MTPFRLRRFLSGFLLGLGFGVSITVAAAAVRGSTIFSDVRPGTFYDDAVGAMYDAGIIKGYADGRFGPDDYVTRGQLAVMLQRLRVELGLAESPEGSSHSSRSRSTSTSSSSSSSSSSPSSSSSIVSVGPQGAIRFTTPTYTANEQDGTVTISVVRTGGNQGTVAVEYALEPAATTPATSGDDYEAAVATLTFEGKSTSTTFTVKINDDVNTEGNEKIKITLRNPTNGAVLGTPSSAEIVIKDNESSSSSSSAATSSAAPSVSLSAAEYSVAEAGGSFMVTVQRLNGTTGTVTVQYATMDGTGKSSSDYTATSGTLTFSSGEATKTFTVSVADDSTIDGNKNFKMNLTNPTGLSVVDIPTATVTIYDDETSAFGSGTLKFQKSNFVGYESQGKAVITVQRVGGAKGKTTVQYSTTNGTAHAGSDYTQTSGTLTFEANEASKTFIVPILSDDISDGEEAVNLLLSAPVGAPLGTPSNATLTLY